jgi:uncharacterized protein YjbI with pentapeptide repeats
MANVMLQTVILLTVNLLFVIMPNGCGGDSSTTISSTDQLVDCQLSTPPHLPNVILTNVILTNVILTNVILTNVILTNVILTNVILTNVILTNVILTNVILTNVILLNAIKG